MAKKSGMKIEGAEGLLRAFAAIAKTAENIMSKDGQVVIEGASVVGTGLNDEGIPLARDKESAMKDHEYRMLKAGKNKREDGTEIECDADILDRAIKEFIHQQTEEIK